MKIPAIPGFEQQAFEKYLKNTSWLVIGRVGSLVIKMFVAIAVANYLGTDNKGILEYSNSFIYLFLAVAALGLDSFIVRELVRSPEDRDKILGTAFGLKLIGGLLIIPLIAIAYFFFGSKETPYVFILIVSFTGVFQSFNIIDSYYQSAIQGKFIMQVNVVGNLVLAALKVVLILLKMPLVAFIWALLADAAILAIGYIIVYHKQKLHIRNWKFNRTLGSSLLAKSWPLMFAAIMSALYMRIDTLMIGNMLGKEQLGIYSTVVSFSEAWYFIPVAIVTSVFPAIINAKKDDEKRYQKRLQNMYDLMVGLSLSIAIVMTFGSDLLYKLFKPEFAAGAAVLKVHIWAGIFVFLGSASGQYLINEGFTQLSLLRTAMGAIVNIVLNLILLPKMGIIGAAWATLAAYFTATFFIVFVPKTSRQALLMLKSLFLISIIQNIRKR